MKGKVGERLTLDPLAINDNALPKIPAWEYVGGTISLIARKSKIPLIPRTESNVDEIAQSPFNVNDVLESTESLRVVQPDRVEEEVSIPGIPTQYRIPNNFRLEAKGTETKYHDLLIETGSSLAEKASKDASVRRSYFGVNANATDYDYGITLDPEDLYGLFSLEQATYSVSLRPQQETWNNISQDLLLSIQQLPPWADADDVHATWRDFFDSWGTHAVLEISYGNRYQLRVTSPDSSSLSTERWRACVEANYTGIIKPTVQPATEEELKKYNQSKQSACYVFGGNREKAMALAIDHENQQKLEDWANSLTAPMDSVVGVKVKSIHTLLKESSLAVHQQAAEKIQTPLDFFLHSPDDNGGGGGGDLPVTDYTISLRNERGADTQYSIFMEPPEFANGGTQPWMNVWRSESLANNQTSKITSPADCHAWVGTVPRAPAPGVTLSSSMTKAAHLGEANAPGSTLEMQITQDVPTLAETTPAAPSGSYEILTGTDFSVPNDRFLIGIAKINHRGQAFPVGSMAPNNNMRIQVVPKPKFFIFEEAMTEGTIADYTSVSNKGATVDFSGGKGQGKNYASVVQHSNGEFEVSYPSSGGRL